MVAVASYLLVPADLSERRQAKLRLVAMRQHAARMRKLEATRAHTPTRPKTPRSSPLTASSKSRRPVRRRGRNGGASARSHREADGDGNVSGSADGAGDGQSQGQGQGQGGMFDDGEAFGRMVSEDGSSDESDAGLRHGYTQPPSGAGGFGEAGRGYSDGDGQRDLGDNDDNDTDDDDDDDDDEEEDGDAGGASNRGTAAK